MSETSTENVVAQNAVVAAENAPENVSGNL